MDIGIDTGYLIISDTFRILGGMDAPWMAIGAIFVVLVVTGISISLIFSRRAGAGILFPIKSRSGRERRNVSTKALTGDEWCARGEQLVSAGMNREALNAYDGAYTLEIKRHELLYRRGRTFLIWECTTRHGDRRPMRWQKILTLQRLGY